MKLKIILCLAFVLSGVLFGCTSVSGSRLDEQRRQLSAAYQDKQRPMEERVKAFDDLLETFTAGTREEVLDKYIDYPSPTTKSRIAPPENGDYFSLHLTAPDGSDRWITMKGDKVYN